LQLIQNNLPVLLRPFACDHHLPYVSCASTFCNEARCTQPSCLGLEEPLVRVLWASRAKLSPCFDGMERVRNGKQYSYGLTINGRPHTVSMGIRSPGKTLSETDRLWRYCKSETVLLSLDQWDNMPLYPWEYEVPGKNVLKTRNTTTGAYVFRISLPENPNLGKRCWKCKTWLLAHTLGKNFHLQKLLKNAFYDFSWSRKFFVQIFFWSPRETTGDHGRPPTGDRRIPIEINGRPLFLFIE
jgi:hypothetical protein